MPPAVARTPHVAAVALEYADRLVLGAARDVHRAVADKTFAATRQIGGSAPEAAHDAVSAAVYDTLSRSLRGAGRWLRSLGDRGVGPALEAGGTGRQVRSAVNALIGAELTDTDDPLAIRMGVRRDGADVAVEPSAVATAYPDATDRIVILLHGLGENDEWWNLRSETVGSTYVTRLAAETAYTPVVIRYNTGLHVSTNGERLSELVEELIEAWPRPVTRIALVGHSMGGLVARAATNHAVSAVADWPRTVGHVICLGTPHLGASLEKAAHLGARALGALPTSAPFGRIIDTRSPGIVDLRHGYITRDEWGDQDLTRVWGLDRRVVAPLPHAEHHVVAATLGQTPEHLASRLLGDLLVNYSSATGAARGGAVVPDAQVHHLPGADHFALLNHRVVGDWLVEWLGSERLALAPPHD